MGCLWLHSLDGPCIEVAEALRARGNHSHQWERGAWSACVQPGLGHGRADAA